MAHRGGIGEENPWVKWAGGSSWSVSVPGLWSSSWHPERGSIAGLPCRHQQGPSVLGSFPSFFPVGMAEHREGNVQFQWAEQSSVFLFVVLSCWSSVLCDFDKKPYLNEATADLIIAESSAFKVQSTSLRASVIPLLQINTVFKSNLSPDHPGSLTESLDHSCHLLKMIF